MLCILSQSLAYNFAVDTIKLPPSIGTTVPVTHPPALLLSHRQAPATSSGRPIRCMGSADDISSEKDSSVAFIILLGNGPSASVLTVMAGPSCDARCFDILRSGVSPQAFLRRRGARRRANRLK